MHITTFFNNPYNFHFDKATIFNKLLIKYTITDLHDTFRLDEVTASPTILWARQVYTPESSGKQ